jgi:hypothetical protein
MLPPFLVQRGVRDTGTNVDGNVLLSGVKPRPPLPPPHTARYAVTRRRRGERIGGDVSDEERIRRVLAEFIQLRDDKRFAEWVTLFTEDATFEYGSHLLVEALLRHDKGKHLCVNSIIDVSDNTASVISDFFKVNPIEDGTGATAYGIGTMGRYEDRFVRRAGEWKIATRRVHIMSPPDGV